MRTEIRSARTSAAAFACFPKSWKNLKGSPSPAYLTSTPSPSATAPDKSLSSRQAKAFIGAFQTLPKHKLYRFYFFFLVFIFLFHLTRQGVSPRVFESPHELLHRHLSQGRHVIMNRTPSPVHNQPLRSAGIYLWPSTGPAPQRPSSNLHPPPSPLDPP
ncbi:hypothetical protein BDY21DRAFT_346583 [Lineolata rhizophorae]|uniref:Uncharacterized protein n=1 Tax=Lineolata rhizophorae TaxID=578093 RepID=A0A6A6NZ46_9PEZI|nr:hypothetical protein BDY21DRAFT_346583 [Lineolata rhizophorae]